MQIVVDIGNSNAVVGIWDGEWKHTWRIMTRTNDEHAFKLDIATRWVDTGYHKSAVKSICISSVVPALTERYCHFFEDFCNAPVSVIGPEMYDRLKLHIDNPNEIGTDLVANAYAAAESYQTGCLIVDFGTALSFLVVSGDRRILGASIAPGIETALRALRGDTAQLPEVPIGLPEQVAGRNTVEAVQSGVILGYEGMVMHLVELYRNWYPDPLKTVATGGVLNALPEFHRLFDVVNPALTLEGIRKIGDAIF